MPIPKPPSRVDNIPFPVFGCTWYGAPVLPPKNIGCSILAYCGGGGSAKTGVNNKISLSITATIPSVSQQEIENAVNQLPPEEVEAMAVQRKTVTHDIDIDTKEDVCFGVHLFDGGEALGGGVFLLAAVGDGIRLYSVPLEPLPEKDIPLVEEEGEEKEEKEEEEEDIGEKLLLGSVHVGKQYGCNVVSYTPLGSVVAVGCENGRIVLYKLDKDSNNNSVVFHPLADFEGHVKAVCTVSFHPRGTHVLSSAKDGTARIWSIGDGKEEQCLTCDINDPDAPAPPQNKNRRPPQVLVRGSAFGDLEGKTIYTVASGRRGAAFLTKWQGTREPRKMAPPPSAPGAPPPPFVPPKLVYKAVNRMKCSPVPVSAMSLSGDGTLLALGGVEGAISLLNLETLNIVRTWPAVHDLPVTCIAARPVPMPLPGESEQDGGDGVAFNAVSASADNKIARVTLQKRVPKKKKPRSSSRRGKSRGFSAMDLFVTLFFIMVLALIAVIIQQALDVCKGPMLDMDLDEASECVWHTVLWADENRPGVRSVPF